MNMPAIRISHGILSALNNNFQLQDRLTCAMHRYDKEKRDGNR